MRDLLEAASRRGYAVGYFEAWDEYSMEACIEAAEQMQSPAILGFGAATTSRAWFDAGGIEELAGVARALASRARVPTAVLFNEARSIEQVERALAAGCNAVMLGAAELPFAENVETTRKVVALARACGASVEGELGVLGDAGGSSGRLTDPEEALAYVRETGVDALSVAIGTAHCHTDVAEDAGPDLELLRRLHESVDVPLVLHGGSGLSTAAVRAVVSGGIRKLNYGTRLKVLFLQELRRTIASLPPEADVQRVVGSRLATDVLAAGKTKVREHIAGLIRLYGSEGKART
jgi:ketose-bisphosphate aldolase